MIKFNAQNEYFKAFTVFILSLSLMIFFEPALAQDAAQDQSWLEKIISMFAGGSVGEIFITVLQAVTMIIGGFSMIARITPWAWDDEAVGVASKILRWLSLIKDPNKIMTDNLAKKAKS